MRILVLVLSIVTVLITSFNIVISLDKVEAQNTNISSSEEVIEKEKNEHEVSEYIEGEAPLYIDGIVVVNKDYGLPRNFKSDLEEEALQAVDDIIAAAKKENIAIKVRSGFRSYDNQVQLFKTYANRDGSSKANTYSAHAGFSEHQTGLAFDFTTGKSNKSIGVWFDDTPQAKWLYENAYKFGFVLRYPEDKDHITGYMHESWHYRYVGKEHSKNFKMNDLTLEEYLGLYDGSSDNNEDDDLDDNLDD